MGRGGRAETQLYTCKQAVQVITETMECMGGLVGLLAPVLVAGLATALTAHVGGGLISAGLH